MITQIIEHSARNKFLVLLLVSIASAAAVWSIYRTPLDAIPDIADTQVIVYSKWMGRSPDLMEDQVTYPIVTALLATPKAKTVRAFSDFGFSYVYVIFEDGTDIYWARTRVLEYLTKIQGTLPPDVSMELGPDATPLGWVFEYALVDETGQHDLAQLTSIQNWQMRYWLQSVEGVAEVATVGGFGKQYQVNVDPNKLAAYGIPLTSVIQRIRDSNNETGGRTVEWTGAEYMVRGRGYIKNLHDLETIAVGMEPRRGVPVYLKDIATVSLGPDMRRGVAELDGKGEVVGGVVVMRYGQNALNVIERVKAKLKEVQSSLPPGVKVVPTYDRSELINESIDTLRRKLIEECAIVSLVCIVFLFHIRSALVAILMLPIAVLLSFIPFAGLKLTSNIMSLGGIAIAIGAMVDAAIVMIENAHKHLEHETDPRRRQEVIIEGAKTVGRALFFTLLVITVSFLPIFTLEEQEGRLFKPLAFTKTFAMAFASLLSVTLVPVLMVWFIRGRIRPETKNPITRLLKAIYHPVVNVVLRFRWLTVLLGIAAIASTVPVVMQIGSEFMPPLYEGSLLYMPTSLPGLSVTEATRALQTQDKVIRSFPEVASVFGKIGRAETSTDPAPFSMAETVVMLKPQREWPKQAVTRWYSSWAPEWSKPTLRRWWPEEEPESWDALIGKLDRALQFPGMVNAWTMPIRTRVDMLTTGIRTPVGVKVKGADLKVVERISLEIESLLKDVSGTRSVFAERVTGGYFLDFKIKREEIARYGLSVRDVNMIIESAIGGENISTTVEGRERYPINLRYARELRGDLPALQRVLVPTEMKGKDGRPTQVPLGQLADIEIHSGPSMIRDENAMLAGYIFVDVGGRDLVGYVNDAKRVVESKVKLPAGYIIEWSGQYENFQRAKQRLMMVIPATLLLIFVLLYLNTKSIVETFIVLLAVPFSLIGTFWLLYLLGYNLSVAVWVGIIALAGLDAETGVVMLLYLDLAYHKWVGEGRLKTLDDLKAAVHEGAVQRIRPKVMTVCAILFGLLPIMWETGAGSDVMKRIAAPMVGGVVTSAILELLIYPAIYVLWKERSLKRTAVTP